MCKKTQEQKNKRNQEILLSLLEETPEENEDSQEKDGVNLNGIFLKYEEFSPTLLKVLEN